MANSKLKNYTLFWGLYSVQCKTRCFFTSLTGKYIKKRLNLLPCRIVCWKVFPTRNKVSKRNASEIANFDHISMLCTICISYSKSSVSLEYIGGEMWMLLIFFFRCFFGSRTLIQIQATSATLFSVDTHSLKHFSTEDSCNELRLRAIR